MSPLARVLVIASAAAAVGLGALLGTRALWLPTLVAAALAALLSWRSPAVVPPVVVSCFYLVPVASLGLTGRWHFSALTPLLAVLLASLAAAIPRTSTLPNPWRASLTCWALVVALSWPIVALREIDFSWPLLWSFKVPTAAGGFPPPVVVGWIAHAAASQLVGLLWLEYLSAVHVGAGPIFIGRVAVPLGVTALGASLLGAYQGYIDLEFLSSSVWPYLRRAGGALTDANASGMLTAMWLTGFIALAASANNRVVRITAILGTLAAALATWCSGSRSALLAVAIGLGVTLIGSVRIIHLQRRVLLTALGGLAAAALVLTFAARGLPRPRSTSPLARIVASIQAGPLETAHWLWNRDGYGSAAVQMIREFPVAGVGVGTFHSIGVDYTKKFGGRALPPDNAQNWYRHQMAELGVVGSVGWLAFVGLFVITIVRTRPTLESSLSANALRGALAGLAVASLVGMPTQHPAIILTFWTFAFWLMQVLGVTTGTSPQRTHRIGWAPATTTLTASAKATAVRGSFGRRRKGHVTPALMVAIVAVHAAATLYSSRHDLRVPYRAARFDFDYSYGFAKEEGSQHVWVPDHAIFVPRALTRSLQLTLRSDSASEERPVGTEISIDGRRVVRRTLRGSQRLVEVVAVPGDSKRFVLEVDVNPASAGQTRPRLALQWEFVR